MHVSRKEEIEILLIQNTFKRPSSRTLNLIEIADLMKEHIQLSGSIQATSAALKLSKDMIVKFLSVDKLSPKVRKLVKERKLDGVLVAHAITHLDKEEQFEVAWKIVNKDLNTQDIKALIPLRKRNPRKGIQQVIADYLGTKNIKVYSLVFDLEPGLTGDKIVGVIRRNFGAETIYDVVKSTGKIKLQLTKDGYEKIRDAAKIKGLSLNKFLQQLIH